MTLRIRESAGTSWPGPRHPGTRHWRSTSVSYGPAFLVLGLLGACFLLPLWFLWKVLLLEAWLAAEAVLLAVTAVLAAVALARKETRLPDLTLTRLGWGLRMVDVR